MPNPRRSVLLGLSIAAIASAANGYRIAPSEKNHERLTAMSETCLRDSPGMPTKCVGLPRTSKAFFKFPHRSKFASESRWADDPTRQLGLGIIKFGVNLGLDKCIGHIGTAKYGGIMCNGHYGTMQFLHAMSSTAQGETVDKAVSEARDITVAKLREWTEFSFRVATGKILPGQSLVAALRDYPRLSTAIVGGPFPWGGPNGWTVASLFSMRCWKPHSSNNCTETWTPTSVKHRATGALFHMIQDSYSRSHARRGGDNRVEEAELEPMVRCSAIDEFYRYDRKNGAMHDSSDLAPAFEPECSNDNSMDPVTAGARMLWLIENDCDVSWASKLITEGVIGNLQLKVAGSREACKVPAGKDA